jgi:hypothetical protein
MLTPEQVEKFQRDGFVKGSQVLDEAQVEVLRAETLRVIENQDSLKQEGRRRPIQIVNLTGKGESPVWQVVNIWMASQPFEQRDFGQMPGIQVVSCPVKKGEVHFHHALCWHGSGLNL